MKGETKASKAFREWSEKNATHLNRHVSIISRQADVFRDYANTVIQYPANSVEFQADIVNLHKRICSLAEEMKEVSDLFAEDCGDFHGVLNELRKEILSGIFSSGK